MPDATTAKHPDPQMVKVLKEVKEAGMHAGVALKPKTPAETLFPYIEDKLVDQVTDQYLSCLPLASKRDYQTVAVCLPTALIDCGLITSVGRLLSCVLPGHPTSGLDVLLLPICIAGLCHTCYPLPWTTASVSLEQA